MRAAPYSLRASVRQRVAARKLVRLVRLVEITWTVLTWRHALWTLLCDSLSSAACWWLSLWWSRWH